MVTINDLRNKNKWWEEPDFRPEEALFSKRELFLTLAENLAHTLILNIVGLRRVGKSTMLQQLIGLLLSKGIKPRNIFYFLFDYDTQLQSSAYLDEVLSSYLGNILKKTVIDIDETVYIMLDEIQYINNWQAIIKRYYDLSHKRIKFIITGSQTILLQGKNHESLAGRIFDYYLPPLSLREFIEINRLEAKLTKRFDFFDLPKIFDDLAGYNVFNGSNIFSLSKEYLITGQFPETHILPTIDARHSYIIDSVLGKVVGDCIRIFDIEKKDEFKLVTQHLINNISSIFEVANIGREIAIARPTLDKYLEYLKESYVIDIIFKHHKSLIKKGKLTRKLYAPCSNFTAAYNHYRENHIDEVPEVFGKIAENFIYNVLAQKYKKNFFENNITFWRQGEKEIDFIVTREKKQLPIEVKFANKVSDNDIKTLIGFARDKNLEFGIVITKNELDKKIINGQMIYFVPFHLALLAV